MKDEERELMVDQNAHATFGYGLGRINVEDHRDERFSLRSRLEAEEKESPDVESRHWWTNGWWGNQGRTSQCVGYSWVHWLDAGPVRQPYLKEKSGIGRPWDPKDIYNRAKRLDQWPGEDYHGTSVRAGAKVLKRKGLIREYRWAWDIETVVETLLKEGPMVVGTWWYSQMYSPDDHGIIRARGKRDGGHAYLLCGVDLNTQLLKIKNSWGRNWGKDGYATIPIKDFEKLLDEGGEACMAFEVEMKAPKKRPMAQNTDRFKAS